MTKVALSLEPAQMYGTLAALGFGQVTTSGYPGESAGLLPHYSHWRPVGISSMSRGYGLSITPLQLAHAYATVAALGVSRPISFLRVETPPAGEPRARPRRLAHADSPARGRGRARWRRQARRHPRLHRRRQDRHRVESDRRRIRHRPISRSFGGIAPASNPRLAAVVIIDEPGAGKYYGGDVAAPVFSGVVGGALRLLAVPPDAPVRDDSEPARQVATR